MQLSDFTVTGPTPPASVPPPSTSSAPPAMPLSMTEQAEPRQAAPAPLATATTEAAPAAQPEAAPPVEPSADVEAEAAAPVEQASPPEPKPGKVDPRFSALARKEAQLFREREAIKAQKAALEQAHRQVVAFEEAKQTAKLNPLAALDALGLSYDEITQQLLNGGKPTQSAEVAAVRQEIEQLRAEQAEAQLRAEEAAQARLEQEQREVIAAFRKDAVQYIEDNGDRYELTKAFDAAHLVPKVIEQHFAKTKELLTVAQGAELVEKHFERLSDRVAKAQKFQARATSTTSARPPTQAAPAPAANPPAQAATPARTLSNSLTASATATAPKPRTDEDRIRAALARLEGR